MFYFCYKEDMSGAQKNYSFRRLLKIRRKKHEQANL